MGRLGGRRRGQAGGGEPVQRQDLGGDAVLERSLGGGLGGVLGVPGGGGLEGSGRQGHHTQLALVQSLLVRRCLD